MKKFFAILLSAIMICSLSACTGNNNGDYPVKIASYTFYEKPDSVVCLSDSVADIIIACGYTDVISARSDECTQKEITGIPSVGKKSEPDINKIAEQNPDVVFADKSVSSDTVKKLNDKGITVLKMVNAQGTEDMISLYKHISAILEGNSKGRENGENKANSIITTMGDLQRIIPESDVVVTACYLYDTDGKAVTDSSFSGKLFTYANAVNVCTVDNPQVMFETIKLSDPQFIFCDKGVKNKIMSDKNFKDFSAVKNKKVYEIDSLLLERQGNSITEVLSFMIETMYPQIKGGEQETSNNENSKQEESKTPEIKAPFEIKDNMKYKQDDENNNIKEIQKRLVELGFMKDDPTGYYGEMTLASVKEFEKTNGLEQNGELDSKDLKILFSSEAKKSSNNTEQTSESE